MQHAVQHTLRLRRQPGRCLRDAEPQRGRCQLWTAAPKDVWIRTSDQSTLLVALEGGVRTVVFEDADTAAACRPMAAHTQLLLKPGLPSTPAGQQVLADAASGDEVARLCRVETAADLQRMEALVRDATESDSASTWIMDATDWKVIPAENLVALAQASFQVRLLAVARSAQDAFTLLGALQVGVHGVLLSTESASEVRVLLAGLRELDNQRLPMQPAWVTRVEPIGQGDRVCVDMTSMLRPGEGLLVGSFARGLFLVHSECGASDFIASRPFRVNAGAVHSYVMGPGQRTSYLSELRAAATCLVVAADGQARAARVGRCKVETRPMVLVEARTACGATHSVVLQNAETIKLVCVQDAAAPVTSSSSSGSRNEDKGVGSVARSITAMTMAWTPVSVSDLRPGKHQVLVYMPSSGPARHTGLPVDEFVIEH